MGTGNRPAGSRAAYRDRIVGPVRGVLPDAVVDGIEESLSGACTTEIAAFDEFTALLTDAALTQDYAHIIFDTALPATPSACCNCRAHEWLSGSRQRRCVVPGAAGGPGKQRSQYKAAVEALADPLRTRLVLVARAQRPTLREAARTHEELAAIGLSQQHLVINGVFPASEAETDTLAAAIYEKSRLRWPPFRLSSRRCLGIRSRSAVQPRGPRRSAPSAGRYRRHVWRRCHRAARPDQCTGLVRPGR